MTQLPSVNIILSGSAMSDLFFNHEHPNIDAFYASNMDAGASDEQYAEMLRAAITDDAKEFLSLIGNPVETGVLVENYLSRL